MAGKTLIFFKDRAAWRKWLEGHHASRPGFWMVFYKNHTGKSGIDYAAAVEEALCFGWIDSLIHRVDDARYARKFTPRKTTTHWSAINLERVKRLKAAGLMTPAGLARLAKGVKGHVPLMQRRIPLPADLKKAPSATPAPARISNAWRPATAAITSAGSPPRRGKKRARGVCAGRFRSSPPTGSSA